VKLSDNIRLLLQMNDRATLSYIDTLEKQPSIKHFFKGYNYPKGTQKTTLTWEGRLAAKAANFI